jgi:hypothetical protein
VCIGDIVSLGVRYGVRCQEYGVWRQVNSVPRLPPGDRATGSLRRPVPGDGAGDGGRGMLIFAWDVGSIPGCLDSIGMRAEWRILANGEWVLVL